MGKRREKRKKEERGMRLPCDPLRRRKERKQAADPGGRKKRGEGPEPRENRFQPIPRGKSQGNNAYPKEKGRGGKRRYGIRISTSPLLPLPRMGKKGGKEKRRRDSVECKEEGGKGEKKRKQSTIPMLIITLSPSLPKKEKGKKKKTQK